MMRIFTLKVAAVSMIALAAGCVSRNNEKGEQARAEYAQSLGDSIAAIERQIDSCNNNIGALRDQVGEQLSDFTTVANPREAGSYIIMTPFKGRYPLKSTGLLARINDNGQFELIAALSGKAFDQITVNGPSVTATSAVVPHDQALNYRTASLTTVSFTGAEADSIGELIADNELNPLTLTYMQGGTVQTWRIPESDAKMIAYTYQLYSTQRELNRLERRVPMLHEKINLLRAHKDK